MPAESQLPPAVAAPAAPCVLLAEDNDDVRAVFAAALTAEHFAVVQVTSGIGLIAQLRVLRRDGQPLDIIVTDHRMPGLSGLRAVALLREAGWRVPVVVMTAFADAETRDEAARLGVDALLVKPVDPAHLTHVLGQLLHRETRVRRISFLWSLHDPTRGARER